MIVTFDDKVNYRGDYKQYKLIYADPPWSYNDIMSNHSFSLDHEYQTQPLEWIKNLPIDLIADEDCALFMWAVSPQLPEAIDVIKAWGFEYKTIAFVWNKVTTKGAEVSNLGRWTMGNVELCLLATRGHPKRIRKDIKQLVKAQRTKHSKKPTVVRERIVQLIGDVPRIELFARETVEGWDSFGDEVKVNKTLETI